MGWVGTAQNVTNVATFFARGQQLVLSGGLT